jgi:3',5'-cyclic AMP phosphodiesterase CpdA
MTAEIRFAHLSDWHATTLVGGGRGLLRVKRMAGWVSWRFNRRHRHSREILEAAIRDVHEQSVDRILVTGDLTHVSLESEFRSAVGQLEMLGSPDKVFLIPGNHDCYVPIEPERSWDHWASYLLGTRRSELDASLAGCVVPKASASNDSEAKPAPRHQDYPTLRVQGRLAVIGLCSAIPTPVLRARGELGATQLDRLEGLLEVLREQGYARVVMLHHPVIATDESARRALVDAAELRAVLERQGADLVLHGHKHRRRVHLLEGRHNDVPIIGVPSSSEVGSQPDKRAQYHVYRLRADDSSTGFQLDAEIRGYDPDSGSFIRVEESLF